MNEQTNTLKSFLARVGLLYRQTQSGGLRWGYLCMVAGSILFKVTFAVLVPAAILAIFFRDRFFNLLLTIDISLLVISILIGFLAYAYLRRLVIRVMAESRQFLS